ncbi:MAG: helix-turn-helix transcriptional regulator [Salibacteraceae bacterium]
MPANKYALLRYRIIDKCIRNKYKPYPSKEELRQACEEALYGSLGDRISDSTIEKDLWAMRYESELGFEAPIRFSKRDKGYYYLDEDYSIDRIPLNDDDVEAIRFAATTLFQFKDVEVFRQFGFAIEKIFDRLNITSNVEDEAIEKFVQFETVGQVEGNQFLGTLLHAIKERQQLEVDYGSFSRTEIKSYRIDPYLLKEYRNRWYLIGFHHEREMILTFGLDRMHRVDTVDHRFELPKDFDADRYFKYSIGITAHSGEPEEVILACTPLQGKYLKTQPLHHSQKILVDTDTEFKIEMHVLITYELIMQILGMGTEAQVIQPESLKKEVLKRLKKSLRQYDQSI